MIVYNNNNKSNTNNILTNIKGYFLKFTLFLINKDNLVFDKYHNVAKIQTVNYWKHFGRAVSSTFIYKTFSLLCIGKYIRSNLVY